MQAAIFALLPPSIAVRTIAAAAAFTLLLPVVSSCDGTTDPVGGNDPDVCAAGTVHTGLPTCTEWEAGAEPHVLTDTVRLTRLTIRPGATVCGTPGSVLIAPEIHAMGSVEQPIVFTACDAAMGWGGLRQPFQDGMAEHDGGTIRNARIEYAEIGVVGQGLKLDSVVIRNTRGPALASLGMTVTNSAVEAACTGECAGSVEMGQYALPLHAAVQSVYGLLELAHVTVRRAGGDAVARGASYSELVLEDVLIEDNEGVGLSEPQTDHGARNGGIAVMGRLRIRGNRSPAAISSWSLHQVLPNAAASDSLRGNQRDTIEVGLVTSVSAGTLAAGLPWRLVNNSQATVGGWSVGIDAVTFEPGATLVGVGVPPLLRTRDLEGTAAQPVTMTGIHLQALATDADTVRVRHVRLDGGSLSSCGGTEFGICRGGGGPVLLQDVDVYHGSVRVRSPGAVLRHISVRGTPPPAEVGGCLLCGYYGSGIEVAADAVEIDGCDITGAAEDGIELGRWAAVAGVRIHGCNLYENGGLGVNNLASDSTTVDASGNWWGDPDGPDGPAGDGVSPGVVFTPWLTAPATR